MEIKEIFEQAETIAKVIQEKGNPYTRVVITDSGVSIEISEECAPIKMTANKTVIRN